MGLADLLVLAGPFLRQVSPQQLTVWLATSQAIGPADCVVEVWDPAPLGPVTQPGPVTAGGDVRVLGASNDVFSLRVLDRLYVHRVVVSLRDGLPRGKVVAYRVRLRTSLVPPPGTYPRLQPAPNVGNARLTSIAVPIPGEWWLAAAHARGAAAVLELDRSLATGDPGPSHFFLLGAPPAAPAGVRAQLARDLGAGSSKVRTLYGQIAADYLVAWSPAICARYLPGNADAVARAAAVARVMANVATYPIEEAPAERDAIAAGARAWMSVAFGTSFARTASSFDDEVTAPFGFVLDGQPRVVCARPGQSIRALATSTFERTAAIVSTDGPDAAVFADCVALRDATFAISASVTASAMTWSTDAPVADDRGSPLQQHVEIEVGASGDAHGSIKLERGIATSKLQLTDTIQSHAIEIPTPPLRALDAPPGFYVVEAAGSSDINGMVLELTNSLGTVARAEPDGKGRVAWRLGSLNGSFELVVSGQARSSSGSRWRRYWDYRFPVELEAGAFVSIGEALVPGKAFALVINAGARPID